MVEIRDYEGYEYWNKTIALPSGELMHWTGSPTLEHFLLVGGAWAQFSCNVLESYGIDKPRILDIGCGCGKTARQFALMPHVQYTGFDLMKDAIGWCNRAFASFGKRFKFVHFDGVSQHYNPGGTVAASSYEFPCEPQSIDLAIAASLFTHLFEPDALNYLKQTARVLAPGGLAIFSIHDRLTEGTFSGSEECINVNGAYFDKLAASVGLVRVHREENLCGQQIHVYQRR